MSIINRQTGWYGYTIDSTGTESDEQGRTKTCVFTVNYAYHINDVNVKVSNGTNDWGAQMGDGSIIPLSAPVVISTSPTGAIIGFTMESAYASNSPCSLVYRSDSASITVEEGGTRTAMAVNTSTGHYAVTINKYGAAVNEHGEVNKLIATVTFPYQRSDYTFDIAANEGCWTAKMGNGSIIALTNPMVISQNRDNAVILFDMASAYASNSPCTLIAASENAYINIIPIADEVAFIAVTDMSNDIPATMVAGTTIDLDVVSVIPYYATIKDVTWDIISGPGIIDNNVLIATDSGTITLRGTAQNGEDLDAITKDYIITVDANVLTIIAQPGSLLNVPYGKINSNTDVIQCIANSTNESVDFKWYQTQSDSYDDAIPINGGENGSLPVPINLDSRDYWFYCEVSSPGTPMIRSNRCHVHVYIECTAVRIEYSDPNNRISGSGNEIGVPNASAFALKTVPIPANAEIHSVAWSTTDSTIVAIDANESIATATSGYSSGSATITVTVTSGINSFSDRLYVDIVDAIPVEYIDGIDSIYEINTSYTLNPIANPIDATYKDVIWEIVHQDTNLDGSIAGATLVGNTIRAKNAGRVHLIATIKNGLGLGFDYIQDFTINFDAVFIPIDDVSLLTNLNTVTSGDIITLNCKTTPGNPTSTDLIWSIKSAGDTNASISGNVVSVPNAGVLVLTATVPNGLSPTQDFTKDFTVIVNSDTFIPVERISVVIENNEVGYEGMINAGLHPVLELPYTVYPSDATNKTCQITLTDNCNGLAKYDARSNMITIDYQNQPAVSELSENIDNLTITFHFVIPNGLKDGDFETDIVIGIQPKLRDAEQFIPVTDFVLDVPNPLRALMPLIMNRLYVYPDNATILNTTDEYGNTILSVEAATRRHSEDDGVDIVMFMQSTLADSWINTDAFRSVYDSPIFDWNRNALYAYSWGYGTADCSIIIPTSSTESGEIILDPTADDIIDFRKIFTLDFLPPYIAVKDITNVPAKIYKGQKYVLSPHCETNGGLNYYNPLWDDEEASYQECIFTGDNINVEGNVIEATKTGTLDLSITVPSGTAEYILWYGSEQQSKDFIKKVSIEVVDRAEPFPLPYIILTLKDESVVELYYIDELSWLCNDQPDTFEITLDGKTFQKKDIVEVEFYEIQSPDIEESIVDDASYDMNMRIIELTSLRNFGWNFTSLTRINTIPSYITGDDCLRNFLRGCTSFNQDITIPKGVAGDRALMYFMRDCTGFNSSITFENGIGLAGESVMHGFLYGCVSFNQSIAIPDTVTGKSCLERFMMGCSKFDQPITIPNSVRGDYCMRDFLTLCVRFNQPLTLPVGIWSGEGAMYQFLKNAYEFHSDITVPANPKSSNGEDAGYGDGGARVSYAIANEQSFSTNHVNSALVKQGVNLVGPGAEELIYDLPSISIIPARWVKANGKTLAQIQLEKGEIS